MVSRTFQLFTTPHPNAWVCARMQELATALEAHGAAVLHAHDTPLPLLIDDRADHVCAIGGDGTLRYVVDAVRKHAKPIPVSIFPAGTVNLVAREIGYPPTAPAFADRLLRERVERPLYFALVGSLPLLACASVGPDSYTVARVSPRFKRLIGRGAYLLAFAKVLIDWPKKDIHVWHDGQETRCQAIYVAKAHFYAGPWSFAPRAALGDPRLHVVTLEKASRTRFFRFAWQLFRRRPLEDLKGVRHFSCESLRISGDDDIPLQSDGDILCRLPATIEVDPDPLQIV